MTSTDYDYVITGLAFACLVIPARDLIIRKDKKGLGKISFAGWWFIVSAILLAVITIGRTRAANSEKRIADIQADSIRKGDKKEIIDAVNLGLSAANLKYDSSTRKVIIDTIIRNTTVYTNDSSIQKKILDETTGGDSMITIRAYIANVNEDSLIVIMSNNTPYTQYDVQMNVFDNFKYQILYKKRANIPMNEYFDYNEMMRKETNYPNYTDKIFKGQWAEIYHTKIPSEFDNGLIITTVKSKNGEYTKTFTFKKYFDTNRATKSLYPFWRLIKEDKQLPFQHRRKCYAFSLFLFQRKG